MKIFLVCSLLVALVGCNRDEAIPDPTFKRNKIVMVVNNRLVEYNAPKAGTTPDGNMNRYFIPENRQTAQSAGELHIEGQEITSVFKYLRIRVMNTNLDGASLPLRFTTTTDLANQPFFVMFLDPTIAPFNDSRCSNGRGCAYASAGPEGSFTLTITAFNSAVIQGTFSGRLILFGTQGFNRFIDVNKYVDIRGTFFVEYEREISRFL